MDISASRDLTPLRVLVSSRAVLEALIGRLNFARPTTFNRVARGMLKPPYIILYERPYCSDPSERFVLAVCDSYPAPRARLRAVNQKPIFADYGCPHTRKILWCRDYLPFYLEETPLRFARPVGVHIDGGAGGSIYAQRNDGRYRFVFATIPRFSGSLPCFRDLSDSISLGIPPAYRIRG